ncbi:MAG: prepilin-type N-terminal cleavage/methylation domain-containing protein [Gammaproteobacteria bacterium]|nr:prepilin-type N-terminal cleavage/methylation domain-containing protein [Gammaproteobacteria bacterium]MYF66156.1 prepilin-type N-terminal cleavage/methylation domain-containing protein [Gammaproteobacteria bacterium]MYK38535.1 prepilin-type N-terminal cleavage/methylation domain-containing protein [Gammaproteobacteria bacterium]
MRPGCVPQVCVMGGRGRPPSQGGWGFSLTELLVTLAILALLAAAATPLWIKQIERARRLDATDALVRVAVLQERFYFENGRYARAVELAAPPPAGLGVAGTERGYYQLRLRAPEGALSNGFAVEAVTDLEGPQAGDEQCRVLSVDSTGRRASESADGEDTTDACWP